MPVLPELAAALASGTVEVIDLTAPLSSSTPTLQLPPQFGQTAKFEFEQISSYDERGPAWYWNNFRTGEHTGTHFDAPCHWVSGKGGEDVASVPPRRLVGPAAVLDCSVQATANPDFLLEWEHIRAWEREHGQLPEGGWLLYRTGWDARSHRQDAFLNADENGPHTPGISVVADPARHHVQKVARLTPSFYGLTSASRPTCSPTGSSASSKTTSSAPSGTSEPAGRCAIASPRRGWSRPQRVADRADRH